MKSCNIDDDPVERESDTQRHHKYCRLDRLCEHPPFKPQLAACPSSSPSSSNPNLSPDTQMTSSPSTPHSPVKDGYCGSYSSTIGKAVFDRNARIEVNEEIVENKESDLVMIQILNNPKKEIFSDKKNTVDSKLLEKTTSNGLTESEIHKKIMEFFAQKPQTVMELTSSHQTKFFVIHEQRFEKALPSILQSNLDICKLSSKPDFLLGLGDVNFETCSFILEKYKPIFFLEIKVQSINAAQKFWIYQTTSYAIQLFFSNSKIYGIDNLERTNNEIGKGYFWNLAFEPGYIAFVGVKLDKIYKKFRVKVEKFPISTKESFLKYFNAFFSYIEEFTSKMEKLRSENKRTHLHSIMNPGGNLYGSWLGWVENVSIDAVTGKIITSNTAEKENYSSEEVIVKDYSFFQADCRHIWLEIDLRLNSLESPPKSKLIQLCKIPGAFGTPKMIKMKKCEAQFSGWLNSISSKKIPFSKLIEDLLNCIDDFEAIDYSHCDVRCPNIVLLDGSFVLIDWDFAEPRKPALEDHLKIMEDGKEKLNENKYSKIEYRHIDTYQLLNTTLEIVILLHKPNTPEEKEKAEIEKLKGYIARMENEILTDEDVSEIRLDLKKQFGKNHLFS